MAERSPVINAQEYLEDAKQVLATWEYVEKSKVENPNPKVFDDLKAHYDVVVNRNFRNNLLQPLKREECAERLKVDELLIRVIASSPESLAPTLINTAWDLNMDGLDKVTMHSEIWNLLEMGILEWTDVRCLKLSPEVREQFK